MIYQGKWHGKTRYFGLHYDLHAGSKDTDIGARCDPDELAESLKLMKPNFVQTDCKGHPGMTSWFSKTPGATISPGVKKDALMAWRKATRKLGVPLHCHYSGIWDRAAGEKFPEWTVTPSDKRRKEEESAPERPQTWREKMCPRGPYVDKLLIPQFIELIDRYEVDGFWVDGDSWGVEPCYCEKCRKAFAEDTGIKKPPEDMSDPDWPAWMSFHRRSFDAYVTKYCEAVHAHKPGVLVCSNWLQTFRNPGEPAVPTDWISGDNTPSFGMDSSRCEARFISTRGKPWDIMLWGFYKSGGTRDRTSPWNFKSPQMIMQEAAVTLALGGNIQVYENPPGLRDGRLAPWRMKILGEVGKFVQERRALCQDTETIPQAVVLHSEHHFYSQVSPNIRNGYDVNPVKGATFALLESSWGVDIMDEWALAPKLDEFSLVIAPEQNNMSKEIVNRLKSYVESGGRLIVSGAAAYRRFGADFLGVRTAKIEKDAIFHIPMPDTSFIMFSKEWRMVKPESARSVGSLGTTPLTDSDLLQWPSATINKVGKGYVAYIPCDIFRFFADNRYPHTRFFIEDVIEKLRCKRDIDVEAPSSVDVTLRRKGNKTIIHLINRLSGIPNTPNNPAVDDIPPAGPVVVEMRMDDAPGSVGTSFEESACDWTYLPDDNGQGGHLFAVIEGPGIHEALVIEED